MLYERRARRVSPSAPAASCELWQAFLRQPTDEDAVTAMAQTFLATVLNFQLVSNCVDESVDLSTYGLETMTVRAVKRRAEQWLEASSFGTHSERPRDWTAGGFDGQPYHDALAAFNARELDLSYPACQVRPADYGQSGEGIERFRFVRSLSATLDRLFRSTRLSVTHD